MINYYNTPADIVGGRGGGGGGGGGGEASSPNVKASPQTAADQIIIMYM